MKVMTPIAWSYIRDGAVPPKDLKEKQIAMDKAKGTYQEPGLLQKLAGKFVKN
jgi:hypothetical protein